MRVGLTAAGASRAARLAFVVALLGLAAGGAWALTHRAAAPAPAPAAVRGPPGVTPGTRSRRGPRPRPSRPPAG
jgi:hypothetical protein